MVLTSPAEFWRRAGENPNLTERVRFEVTVYYYDPVWNLLWGDCAGDVFFLQPIANVPGLRSGQRVCLEGKAILHNGMSIDELRATVLDPSPLIVPLVVGDRITEIDRLQTRLTTVVGLVDRQTPVDPAHARLEVIVGDTRVIATVFLPNNQVLPPLETALIEFTGVYVAKRDAAGEFQEIAFWIPGPDRLRTQAWLANDPRFELPRTPIGTLGTQPVGRPVRVQGCVQTAQSGRQLTIRDETAEVQVFTKQYLSPTPGAEVEAIGYPSAEGINLYLRRGVWRQASATLPRSATLDLDPRLRLAGQIMDLPGQAARRGLPASLHAVVTWSNAGTPFLFASDTSGGVRIQLPPGLSGDLPEPGRVIEVQGTTIEGDFSPAIAATSLRTEDLIVLPAPKSITLEQAFTGAWEAQAVEFQGFVRQVQAEGAWIRLDLTSATGEFVARWPAIDQLGRPYPSKQVQGSIVRVRGVCSALANHRRQLVGIEIWLTSPDDIEVDDAAHADPFDAPEIKLSELRQYGTVRVLNRRVRTHGVVVFHDPGHTLGLQDGSDVVELLARGTTPLAPGDQIIAVGFPGRESGRPVLREALYRKLSAGPEPETVTLHSLGTVLPEFDGRLVRAEGTLQQVAPSSDGLRLMVQTESALFEAQLPAPPTAALRAAWLSGTKIQLTGVYRVQFDEYRQPRSFRIQLRTPGDVRILVRPAWWTAERALALAGFLGLSALLVAIWVAVLARRVNRQTAEIRHQLEKQAQLESELHRANRLESLGVLAGGIAHDFNNLLTVVMGNLTMALLDERVVAAGGEFLKEAERGALRARDLTQQLITFARGGSPLRTAVSLPEIVREVAGITLRDSPVTCECEVAPDLWTADVDRDQIGEVVRNLALTAQQAMPAGGVLTVDLANDEIAADQTGVIAPGRYVRLTFADAGEGIPAEKLSRIFDPYFTPQSRKSSLGLATVYSIVKRHDGHITVESPAGRGTTFRIWLPAAQPADPAPPVPAATPAPAPAGQRHRVLVMDDEPGIRKLVMRMLERQGYDVTGAPDGEVAVREFTAAREAGHPFDVLIFDLTIPGGMGGRDAIALVRRVDPAARAIVSSGYSDDATLGDFRAQGFDAVVPKPYDVSRLIETVQRLLATPR